MLQDGEVSVVPTELITRARAGDGDAFRDLIEPHRRELQVHCYRMLGSFQDAEDALQVTLLAAWQGFAGFEGRSSLRTWLYRIATNRCLNARRAASRRPAKEWDVPQVEPPTPTRLGEVVWLEPYPDALLDGAMDHPLGPEARYEQRESISLVFLAALQVLPATSARRRRPARRARVQRPRGSRHARLDRRVGQQRPQAGTCRSRASVAADRRPASRRPWAGLRRGNDRREVRPHVGIGRSRRAGGTADRRRLHVDATHALRVRRANVVARFCAAIFGAGRRFELVGTQPTVDPRSVPTSATPTASATGPGCTSIGLSGDRICAMTRFDNSVLPWFGLHARFPAGSGEQPTGSPLCSGCVRTACETPRHDLAWRNADPRRRARFTSPKWVAAPIELFARVVPYEIEGANRYSWHGDLHPYLHQRGTLILDNGTEIEVAVRVRSCGSCSPSTASGHGEADDRAGSRSLGGRIELEPYPTPGPGLHRLTPPTCSVASPATRRTSPRSSRSARPVPSSSSVTPTAAS